MLGKLIKYDLKVSAKLFILLHAAYLLVCVISRFLYMDNLNFQGPAEPVVISLTLFISVLTILMTALMIFTELHIALRFYRSMFSREGYLSWTLPATPSTHLLAKFLSGYLIAAADIIIIAAGILVLVTGSNVADAYRQIAPDMEKVLGITLGSYALKLFLFTVIFTFTSIVQIYFCIALGQLFQEHRVLLAIAFYFLAGFGVQILTTSLLLITGLIRPQMFADSYSFNMGRYTDILYLITGILSIILAVIEYMVTNYIMKRKINLI